MNAELEKFLNHILDNHSIAHYGVKGQKWGVRRENPSGGTTSPPHSEDWKRVDAVIKKAKTAKTTKVLRNDEMQAMITRMNLEQQYSRLKPLTGTQKVLRFVGNILANVGKQQATSLISGQAAGLIGAALRR